MRHNTVAAESVAAPETVIMCASVPSNVLLFGEYAVLERGGLGIASAISPRIYTTVSHARTFALVGMIGGDTVRIDACDIGAKTPRSTSEQFMSSLLHALLMYVYPNIRSRRAALRDLAVTITIDARACYNSAGQKIGLGSSAATAVSLAAALYYVRQWQRNIAIYRTHKEKRRLHTRMGVQTDTPRDANTQTDTQTCTPRDANTQTDTQSIIHEPPSIHARTQKNKHTKRRINAPTDMHKYANTRTRIGARMHTDTHAQTIYIPTDVCTGAQKSTAKNTHARPPAYTAVLLSRQVIFNAALKAHRACRGRGSGYDIAASVFGGTILFRGGRHPHIRACTPFWKNNTVGLLYGAESVNSADAITQYETWKRRQKKQWRRCFKTSNRIIKELVHVTTAPALLSLINMSRELQINIGDCIGVSAHFTLPEMNSNIRTDDASGTPPPASLPIPATTHARTPEPSAIRAPQSTFPLLSYKTVGAGNELAIAFYPDVDCVHSPMHIEQEGLRWSH